jgi:hypothetical protein
MNVNDLKANDIIRTKFIYYLTCRTKFFLNAGKKDTAFVSYVSSDYIIFSGSGYYNHVYLFLNAEEIESTIK